MRMVVRSILLGALVPLSAAPAVTAQSATEPAPGLVEEVEALRKTVENAVVLLDRALSHQRLELLLKRIELKERRVVPLEAELRRARDQLSGSRDEIDRFERMLEEAEAAISEEIRDGTDREDSESRYLKARLEQEMDHVRRLAESDEDRVRSLEDELAERLEEIEILEHGLEERLERLE